MPKQGFVASPSAVLQLQKATGNGAVSNLLRANGIRAPGTERGTHRPAGTVTEEASAAGPVAVSRDASVTRGSNAPVAMQRVAVQRFSPPIGEKYEFSWDIGSVRDRVKISGTIAAARHGAAFVEAPSGAPGGAGEAKWSILENKASIKKGTGKWGSKLSSALANWDWSGAVPGFEYLKAGFSAKALEGSFDRVKKEADLDLLKVAVSLRGDAKPILHMAGLGHLADRVSIKAQLKATVGLGPRDLARLKVAFRAKEEIKAAGEALDRYAREYGRAATDLDRLDKERGLLKSRLDAKVRTRTGLERQLAELESAGPQKAGRRSHQRRIKDLNRRLRRIAGDVERLETQAGRNMDKARDAWRRAKEARKGLGEAGGVLHKAGRRFGDAVKGLEGKLGKIGARAVDKAMGKVMKKLGRTLAKKVLAKLIPGLNIVSTAMDIAEVGMALWELATGKRRFGLPFESEFGDEDSGETEGTDTASGGRAGSAEKGTGDGTESGGQDSTAGTGGTEPGGGSQGEDPLDGEVRQVLEALESANLMVEPQDAEVLNQLIPRDITADELEELKRRLGGRAGDTADPYALAAAIQSELDDIRAGGTKVTAEGEAVDVDSARAEPPVSLLPMTRQEVVDLLLYDEKSGQMVLGPEGREATVGRVFTHQDGLKVLVSSVEATSVQPDPDVLIVSVSIGLQVHALPSSVEADYPYTEHQTDTEKMTFVYSIKQGLWGELDYTLGHGLRSLLAREEGGWKLARQGAVLKMQHASIRVDELVGYRDVAKADGGVQHKFLLKVTPVEITAEEAGYRHAEGWVRFEKGRSVEIPFAFSEDPVPAAAQ